MQSEKSYLEEIDQARHVLKGNISVVEQYFKKQMSIASANLEFERAHNFLNKISLLEKFQTKSLVVNRSITDIDVITISSTPGHAYINYMQIKEGAIIFSKSVEIKKRLDETDDEILLYALQELRDQSRSENSTIFTNVPIDLQSDQIEFFVPKIGDKRKLVELSLKNALELRKEKEILREGKKSRNFEVLSILQQDMRLPNLPRIIECFDNSNFQGTTPVASMVRFDDGKPDKKGYRHFNIKTVVGPDDFASMKEIVGRRYKRVIEENLPLPNLILIDGGKGQLSNACEALKELELYGKIPIAGIAKKLEEIYYPEDPLPLHINKKSPGLLLLQQIRDEAHRFAITFHRQKRSKATIKTALEDIPGIGKETASKLLKHFKSTKKILEAPLEDLEKVVGYKRATVIKGIK
jgi:excinuclease ABC subunit C